MYICKFLVAYLSLNIIFILVQISILYKDLFSFLFIFPSVFPSNLPSGTHVDTDFKRNIFFQSESWITPFFEAGHWQDWRGERNANL
jgi:hypothetical protein